MRNSYITLKVRTNEIYHIYSKLKITNQLNNFTKDFETLFSLNNNDDFNSTLKNEFTNFLNNIENKENIVRKINIFCKKWTNLFKNSNEISKCLENIKKMDSKNFKNMGCFMNERESLPVIDGNSGVLPCVPLSFERIISEELVVRINDLYKISEDILQFSKEIDNNDLPHYIKAIEMYC